MKIDPSASLPETAPASDSAVSARAAEGVCAGSNQNQEDTVVCKVAPSLSSERELKIAELRKSYLEGTYQVDTAALSAKIVDEHIEIRD